MSHPMIVDGRNLYDPARMREMGFVYWGMGRGLIERFNDAGALNRMVEGGELE